MRFGVLLPSWPLLVGLVHLVIVCSGEKGLKPILSPKITDTQTDVMVTRGKTAKIKCTVINQGTKTVIWRRVDTDSILTIGTFPYVANPRVRTVHNKYKNIWTLHITKVELSDAGVYECQVSSKEHIYKHFRLIVTEPDEEDEEPVPRIALTGKKYVEIGQPIELFCNATDEDEAPMDVDWFKDGDKINAVAGSDIDITKLRVSETKVIVSKLFISKARKEDKGDYVCRVGSDDKDAASFHLYILDAATINVKRGTEKDVDRITNAEKNKGEEVKDGVITYDTGKGSGLSISTVSMTTHPVYLITWTCVLLHLFQCILHQGEHAITNSL